MTGTARVAQVWPVELKERLRQRVGNRGLTEFTIEAVEEKLDGRSPTGVVAALDEARLVARRLLALIHAHGLEQGQTDDWAVRLQASDWPEWLAKETGHEAIPPLVKEEPQTDPGDELRAPSPSPGSHQRPDEAQAMTLAAIRDTYGLVSASGVTAPTVAEARACPTCKTPLVSDECWACAF